MPRPSKPALPTCHAPIHPLEQQHPSQPPQPTSPPSSLLGGTLTHLTHQSATCPDHPPGKLSTRPSAHGPSEALKIFLHPKHLPPIPPTHPHGPPGVLTHAHPRATHWCPSSSHSWPSTPTAIHPPLPVPTDPSTHTVHLRPSTHPAMPRPLGVFICPRVHLSMHPLIWPTIYTSAHPPNRLPPPGRQPTPAWSPATPS